MEEEENRCLFIKVTGNDIQLAKWQMLANVFAQRLETRNTSFTITPIDNRFAGSGLSANSLRIQAGLPVQPELPVEPQEANDNQQTGLPMEEKRCIYIKIIGNDHQLINWQMCSHALTIQAGQPMQPEIPVEPEEANLGHEDAEQPDEAEIVNMEE
ncbi:hypothetical protein CRE_21936 [Caenorhabditis remanei]|uniref:Uncharacterized protein n=1 Tax=Caenorhabditis remanei TaxID=31234 RepID=E3MUF6_CAERE|nr:hypothetical protein CRE_21936 [Caenorhabditis remanei]